MSNLKTQFTRTEGWTRWHYR